MDQESGRVGQACARLGFEGHGGEIETFEVLGVSEEVRLGSDGFPDEVTVAAQATRFVRDPSSSVPVEPPRLEVRVAGPPAGRSARRFCGRAPDISVASGVALSRLPVPAPDGRSCLAQATAYAREARRGGWRTRIVLGVAQDGRGFVWHAWVEVRAGAGWLAVDPAFGQLPAQGPRFAVARHRGDAKGVFEAGSRILACWGRAAIE